MGELEKLLLEYYSSKPIYALSWQELDEYVYLLMKQGLDAWNEIKGGKPRQLSSQPKAGTGEQQA